MHDDDVFGTGADVLSRLAPDGAAPPWETLADLAPVLGRSVGHAFGAIISRPGLDLRTRELTTVSVLAAMGGCEPQLAFHIGGALRAGATAPEIIEALTQVSVYAGLPRALNAVGVAREVFAEHGVSATAPAPRAVVTAWLDSIARRDREAALEMLAEDVAWTLPGERDAAPWAGTWLGRDGVTELQAVLAAELDVEHFKAGEPLPAGDRVFVPASFTYRHAGDRTPRAADVVLEIQVRDGQIRSFRLHGGG